MLFGARVLQRQHELLQRLPALLVRLRLLRRSRLLHLSGTAWLLRSWLHIRSHHHLIGLVLLLLLLLLHSHHRLLLLLRSIGISLHSPATSSCHHIALHHLLLIRIGRSQSTTAAALISSATPIWIPRPLVHRQKITASTTRSWPTTADHSSHTTNTAWLLLLLHLRSIWISWHATSNTHMATHRSLNAWWGHLHSTDPAAYHSRTNNASSGTNIACRRHHFSESTTIGHLLPGRLFLHLFYHLQHISRRGLSRQLLLLLHADARLMVWTTHSADRTYWRGDRSRRTHSTAGSGSIHSAT